MLMERGAWEGMEAVLDGERSERTQEVTALLMWDREKRGLTNDRG
jgi:hypothetical protein